MPYIYISGYCWASSLNTSHLALLPILSPCVKHPDESTSKTTNIESKYNINILLIYIYIYHIISKYIERLLDSRLPLPSIYPSYLFKHPLQSFTDRSASTASVGETVSASRSGAVVSAFRDRLNYHDRTQEVYLLELEDAKSMLNIPRKYIIILSHIYIYI